MPLTNTTLRSPKASPPELSDYRLFGHELWGDVLLMVWALSTSGGADATGLGEAGSRQGCPRGRGGRPHLGWGASTIDGVQVPGGCPEWLELCGSGRPRSWPGTQRTGAPTAPIEAVNLLTRRSSGLATASQFRQLSAAAACPHRARLKWQTRPQQSTRTDRQRRPKGSCWRWLSAMARRTLASSSQCGLGSTNGRALAAMRPAARCCNAQSATT
jgi:hypothetical protein